jgi:hypothetical protein
MRVFIIGFEDEYKGQENLCSFGVFNVRNLDEANDIGKELSKSIINNYKLQLKYYNGKNLSSTYIHQKWDIYYIKEEYSSLTDYALDLFSIVDKEKFILNMCEEKAS